MHEIGLGGQHDGRPLPVAEVGDREAGGLAGASRTDYEDGLLGLRSEKLAVAVAQGDASAGRLGYEEPLELGLLREALRPCWDVRSAAAHRSIVRPWSLRRAS